MSDRSKEWDKRTGTRGKLPFTPYALILGGILVLLITLIIIFTTQPIYAQLFGSTEEIVDLDQSYHIVILQTQALLMDKIDWNNCVLDIQSRYSYTSSILILKACGEIP